MQIAVIGTGYVGLVSGAGFADFGHAVTCVDRDASRIASLRGGVVPFFEPGLDHLVASNVRRERLTFTTSVADAVARAKLVVIAVGTPSGRDGRADISLVLEAAREIGAALAGFTVVVVKSTVPVGTTEQVRDAIAAVTSQPFAVASNPEFLKEGDAVHDFLRPARIVIGTDDPRALELLRELYTGITRISDRVHATSIRSAELTKYAANAMLATRISLMNELAQLCDAVGADIEDVRKGIGSDPRIGGKFLFAGAGFGGSCLPKDLRALRQIGADAGVRLAVVDAVERVNERQKHVLADLVCAHFGGSLADRRVAVWGLSFKPATDDIRESPALALIGRLREAGAHVTAYDPAAMDNARAALGDAIDLARDAYEAVRDADALVLVTEWHELRHPDYARLAAVMRGRALFDGRNVWSPAEARRAGFSYRGIGRADEVRAMVAAACGS